MEPDFIVGVELKNGALVPVLESFEAPALPIYAVYPSRKHLSAKVRLFVEFLLERFSQSQEELSGGPHLAGTGRGRSTEV